MQASLYTEDVVDTAIVRVLTVCRETLDPLPPEARVEVLAALGSMFCEAVDEFYAEAEDPYWGRSWEDVTPDPAYL